MEEKEILKKLRQAEISVANNIRTLNRELLQTRYYEQFTVNSKQGPITLKNPIITIEQDEAGKISYHFRWFNEDSTLIEEKILVEDGMVYTIPELEEIFGNTEMDIEQLINENDKEKGNLKGISEKVTPEQAKKSSDKRDGEDNSDKEKGEETQKIESDLADQGEEIRIGKHRKIKDDKIAERIPEVFEEGKEYEIAEERVTGEVIILVKENGQYKKNEKVEPGEMTTKRIFSIEPNGELKESEIPDQSMRVKNNPQIELASNKDEYGDLEMQTVHVTPCQSRIARPVQMQGQMPEENQEQKEVTDIFAQKGGEQLADEIAHKKKELEETYKVTETHIEELRELDIEAVMEAEAQKAKISKEGFKEYVKKADGKTLQDKINNAHEEIEQEYMGGQRPR